MNKHNLYFFYGSLRSGYWNNGILAGAKLIGAAITIELFNLYVGRHGPVPCVVPDPEKGVPLVGEMWELDGLTAQRVDRLEFGYSKGLFEVMQSGVRTKAYIYHADKVKGAPYIGTDPILIESGDYADAYNTRNERILKSPSVKIEVA